MWCTNRLFMAYELRLLRPDFYAIYEPFLLGVGVVFNIGQCFGNPNPYNLSKEYSSTPRICTAVRPPLYRRPFLASKLRRKGNPAIRLPFVLQYASHLYGKIELDAAFLLTVGSFLLTVELFLLTVENFSFLTYSRSFFAYS